MSRFVFAWLTGFISGLPLWLGYLLADLSAGLHWHFFPSRRHAVLANLAVILPRAARRDRVRVGKSIMRAYNRMLFEFFRLPHLSREELLGSLEVEGREHLEQAVARGRGTIITCSHLGNWELAGVAVAHWGYTLHAVAGVQLTRWLTPAVRETKTELAIHTVSPEDGFRKLLRALERNELIALMVDGDIYSHGVQVEMFGRETRFPAGPSVLAQRTGALIVPGYCQRVGPGRFRIHIDAPIDPASFPTTAALSQAVASITEKHIRANVDQWCIFRGVWEAQRAEAGEPTAEARRVRA